MRNSDVVLVLTWLLVIVTAGVASYVVVALLTGQLGWLPVAWLLVLSGITAVVASFNNDFKEIDRRERAFRDWSERIDQRFERQGWPERQQHSRPR